MTRNNYLKLQTYLLALFVLASGVSWLLFDKKVVVIFKELRFGRSFEKAVNLIDKLGSFYYSLGLIVVMLLILILLIYFTKANKLKSWFSCLFQFFTLYLINLIISDIITYSLKRIVGKARPEHFLKTGQIDNVFFTNDYNFHSFPSGHATNLACLIITVVLFFKIWQKGYTATLLILTLSFLTFTRLILFKHYPSDLFAGYSVAIISGMICFIYQDKIYKIAHFFQNKLAKYIN